MLTRETKQTKQSPTQMLFENVVCHMCDKLRDTPDTIFTGVDMSTHLQEIQESFKANVNEFEFLQAKPYEQRKMIKEFMESVYLSEHFTFAVDSILLESSLHDLSFAQQYKIENTKSLNVKYLGENTNINDEDVQMKLFEEALAINVALGAGIASIGTFLGIPLLPIVAVSVATVAALELITPIAKSAEAEKFAEKMLGSFGKLLFSSKPFYILKDSPLSKSIDNVINFDNLHLNKEVTKLFATLQRSSSKNDVVRGLESLFSECENQSMIYGANLNNINMEEFEAIQDDKYDRSKVSILKMLYNNVMKGATTEDESTNKVLLFRKCIIEKLCDMYKYLVLSNSVNSREYKKIASSLANSSANGTRPEQLFSFVSSVDNNDKSAELLRENLITLVQIRLEFDKMSKNLSKGSFKVDTESGKYFEQLLKRTDREIEDQLKNHGRRIDTLYENRREFEKKDFKNNPQQVRRSLFKFNND